MENNLTEDNYFSIEAGRKYWSNSQFKAFNKCEAAGLAEVAGDYTKEKTEALLIGSYVDAYFSGGGEFEKFQETEGASMFKKNGELYAKFEHANELIRAIENQPLMMQYLKGDRQKIMTGELFGVPWKIKMDVYKKDECIVDLKTVKDFEDVWDPGYGYRPWLEYWGYDIQGFIYTRIEQAVTGRADPLPFYIVAVTKEKTPDVKIIHVPDHILQAAGGLVEAKIDRFDLIKKGEVEPIRCECCDYCKSTKVLTAVEEYEIKEAQDGDNANE